jgi:signal transduction histidine kinase
LRDSDPDELSEPQRRMLDVISRNTRRLRDLVEDILTLSKIESGGYGSDRTPLDFAKVIDRALVTIGPVAAKNGVTLHLDVRGPLPVRGDGAQLDRVLDNLLTNAVKFTPAEGMVTVKAERRGHQAVLVVADTGMGIPAAEQQALFGRFFRATNAIKQAIPGTGLGLAIARTIIDNHSGTIEVASDETSGTTVTVRLPADLAARETPSAYGNDDDAQEYEGESDPINAWHAERAAHAQADTESAARTETAGRAE